MSGWCFDSTSSCVFDEELVLRAAAELVLAEMGFGCEIEHRMKAMRIREKIAELAFAREFARSFEKGILK